MKNVKATIQSLHTAIAVVIVAFAIASWGMMAYMPAITEAPQAYAQETEQPIPSSSSTNITAGGANENNNETEAVGVCLFKTLWLLTQQY